MKIESIREYPKSKRRAISKPIIKEFMDKDMKVAKITLEDTDDISPNSLYASIRSYIKNHELPIQLIKRGEFFYLVRNE